MPDGHEEPVEPVKPEDEPEDDYTFEDMLDDFWYGEDYE